MTTIDRGDGGSTGGNDGRANPRLSDAENATFIAWLFRWVTPDAGDGDLQRIMAKYAAVGRAARTRAALLSRALQDGRLRLEDL